MNRWRKVKVGDFAEVARGSSPRPIHDQRYFEGGTIPWIKIADATKSGKYLYKTNQYVNEYGASFSRLLPVGSLIIAASGTLGYTQLLGVEGCVHDGWLFFKSVDSSMATVDFLYYLFKYHQAFFYNSAYGAAIQNVNTMILSGMEIMLPPLDIQQKIASILSRYDDLIENNTRRISVLDQLGRNLYLEWFVHFRFPGHESVEFIQTDEGILPKGWKKIPLRDICGYINRGIAPKYDDAAECIVINQKCIRNGRLDFSLARRNGKVVPNEKYVQRGDILVNSTGEGTLGRVAQVYFDVSNCTVDSHVSIVRPSDPRYADYLGIAMIERQSYLATLGEGATNQTELTRSRLGNIEFAVSPPEIAVLFSQMVVPLRSMIENLTRKNTILEKTRDLLLPRLVSGELDVSELYQNSPELIAAYGA